MSQPGMRDMLVDLAHWIADQMERKPRASRRIPTVEASDEDKEFAKSVMADGGPRKRKSAKSEEE